ncbi:MAG: YfcE family phosphodiesterase [Clostridia bacterium]
MKTIFVFSDLHNVAVNNELTAIMCESDFVFFCGDGLNGLSWLQKLLGNKFYAVKGNCDYCGNFPESRLIKVEDITFLITHGHLFYDRLDLAYSALEQGASCVLYGHSHLFEDLTDNGVRLINVGSLSSSPLGFVGYTYIVVNGKNIFAKFVKTT